MMNRATLLRKSFHTGITLKGIDGVLETIGGVALWFISPSELNALVRELLQHELSRDPHDFIAAHFIHLAQRIAHADPMFASLYLLTHGVVKIVLVIALWANKLWAYPLTIAVFGGFMVYQTYRWTHTHSFTLGALTVFDAIVIWLTWREFEEQKADRSLKAAG